MRILDLGCGSGGGIYDVIREESSFESITGIDRADHDNAYVNNVFHFLQVNHHLSAQEALSRMRGRIKFERTSIEDFDAPPNSFDFVIAHNSLHFLTPESRKAVVERAFGYLSPNGLFKARTHHFTATHIINGGELIGEHTYQGIEDWNRNQIFYLPTLDELTAIFEDAGFETTAQLIEDGDGITVCAVKHLNL